MGPTWTEVVVHLTLARDAEEDWRAPARLLGGSGHHSRRPTYWDYQRVEPHPSLGRTDLEKSGVESSKDSGGGGFGHEWVLGHSGSGKGERARGGSKGSRWSSGEVRKEGECLVRTDLVEVARWPWRQRAARRAAPARWRG